MESLDSQREQQNVFAYGQQIDAKPEAEQAVYDEDLDLKSKIGPDRAFHLDPDGNLIVEFEKYEIAVGAAGPQSFTLDLDSLN